MTTPEPPPPTLPEDVQNILQSIYQFAVCSAQHPKFDELQVNYDLAIAKVQIALARIPELEKQLAAERSENQRLRLQVKNGAMRERFPYPKGKPTNEKIKILQEQYKEALQNLEENGPREGPFKGAAIFWDFAGIQIFNGDNNPILSEQLSDPDAAATIVNTLNHLTNELAAERKKVARLEKELAEFQAIGGAIKQHVEFMETLRTGGSDETFTA